MNESFLEQFDSLDSTEDKLWWLAQLERGVEVADIEREAVLGSTAILDYMASKYPPTEYRGAQQQYVQIWL